MERWAVAANFVGRRLFRWGAKVQIILTTGGDPSRAMVRGLNIGGRRIEAWVRIGDLRSFRPLMAADGWHTTKAAAATDAAGFDWCRAMWGSRCPLLTWRQHHEILLASRADAEK